jgi:hypothetical protein
MIIFWFNIDQQQQSIALTEADEFVLKYMLGMVSRLTMLGMASHGHVRVRNLVGAIQYLRLAYGLGLVDAKEAAETFEEEYNLG